MTASKIEWTDRSDWNPIRGCTRVSEGCRNCYAERIAARFSDPGQPFHGIAERAKSGPRWTGKMTIVEERLDLPLRWRKPARIFVNSMFDLFHEAVPDDWIDRVFAVMALAPQHVFMVLTKRAARMRAYMGRYTPMEPSGVFPGRPGPLPNVWLGCSVEDQARADERIPDLLATPAAVRFVSAEPLLSGVDLSKWLHDGRRERLSGSGGVGLVHGETGRHDLAERDIPRRRGIAADLDRADTSGAQRSEEGQLSQSDVQRCWQAAKGSRAPDRMDDLQPPGYPGADGDQPRARGRGQTAEPSQQPYAGDKSAERRTLFPSVGTEDQSAAGRGQRDGESNRRPGNGDQSASRGTRLAAAGDRQALWPDAERGISDSDGQELGIERPRLDWVICGGESGPGARPAHPDWFRALRDQCAGARVPYFFKQWGEYAPADAYASEQLEDFELRGMCEEDGVVRVGKRAAGHLLDGREHREFPA